jgi:hypothetical protein
MHGRVLCRCERKALNDMNHANDTQALRYPVMATNDDGSSSGKVKQRITSAQEKLFILVSVTGQDTRCVATAIGAIGASSLASETEATRAGDKHALSIPSSHLRASVQPTNCTCQLANLC